MKFLLSICILFYFNAFGFSQNLALNKTISGHTDLKNVKYVFDGNRLTSTETDYKISRRDQIWVSVDLEEMQYIKSIVFVPKQYFLQHTTHQIFLMNKKKEWEKFLEFTVYLNNNTPFTKEINKKAQGIKIVTIETSSFFGWYEIEINGKNPTSPYTYTEDDKARAIFEYVKAECGNLTAYQRFYLIGTSSPFVKTVDSLFLNCYLPKESGSVFRGYIGKDEQVLYKQTRPELKPFVENFIFHKLKSETPLGRYENKPYSGNYFEFISVFPDNPNNGLLKEIGDKYKKMEDAERQKENNLKISKREAQERWERNNSSSSSDVNDRSEKIKVKLMETKNEKNILSPDRVIYKYRLKQGSRTKNIEIYYTPTEDSWSISCDFFGAPHSKEEAIEKCLDDFDCNGCDWEWEY